MLGIKHSHLDITRHIVPDQARFEPKYFLALTEGSPSLFNLRSVFPGRQSYRMEQSCQKAMPQWQLPCEQWESPPQNSSHNYSRLHCLITLAQITEGKKLVEPAEVSIEDFFEVYFLDQEYSGLHDHEVRECIECYLNLPEASHWITLTFVNCSSRMNDCLLYK
jgi:hypothetical protein